MAAVDSPLMNRAWRQLPRTSWPVIAFLVAFWPSTAFAYIDPGSGSMLLQILMSAFFGALFMARNFLGKLAASARRAFSKAPEPQIEEKPDQPSA